MTCLGVRLGLNSGWPANTSRPWASRRPTLASNDGTTCAAGGSAGGSYAGSGSRSCSGGGAWAGGVVRCAAGQGGQAGSGAQAGGRQLPKNRQTLR